MSTPATPAERASTRRGLFRAMAGAGAVVAGGAAIGARTGGDTSLASPSPRTDAEILNFMLLLEHVQAGFYRQALEGGLLSGELRDYAATVAPQEADHVRFLRGRLGGRARPAPETDFSSVLSSAKRFRATAVELEEAAVAGYIGQGANLTAGEVAHIAGLVAVEARQAAWLRDLAGVSPAPRAADPARAPRTVLAHLRRLGVLR
jgi:Ferritin-like domain